jgi:predicted dehydrogenase
MFLTLSSCESYAMSSTNRRQFVKTSATLAAAGAFAAPSIAKSTRSANDRIRIGLLGLGGRMKAHVSALNTILDQENIELAAVCDCDKTKLDKVGELYPELAEKKFARYTDMHELLSDASIDAVDISLGDRWHALATIWACQAGKDVYVEKPGTHNLFEGRQMVAAARKYNRMVQHGTQNRSSASIAEGIAHLHDGTIGDLYMARGLDYKLRGNLGKINPSPVPEGLDWDRWLGPKPMRPYSTFWHSRWYWNLELASGCFANQAIHELDVIRWGLGLNEHPVFVHAQGGKYVHEDDRTSPTHVAISYQFAGNKPMLTYEHRSWYTNSEAGFRDKYPFVQPDCPVGTIFFGSEGYLIFPDYSSYHSFLGRDGTPGPSKSTIYDWQTESAPHFANWIRAIRARDHKVLNADILEAHRSMALALLPRVSFEVGRPLKFDPATERVIGDDQADRLLNQPDYRSPYVVPEKV